MHILEFKLFLYHNLIVTSDSLNGIFSKLTLAILIKAYLQNTDVFKSKNTIKEEQVNN